MLNMFNLIRNESMKLSRRVSTWIMVGILILIVIAAGLLLNYNAPKISNKNWKANLTEQNKQFTAQLNRNGVLKAEKDSISQVIKTNEYRIAHNISPNSDNTLWGFVEGASSIISIIALFAIIIGGGIVANEFSAGTIKLLLIRPSKRWKILLSKYLTVLGYILFMLVILFVVSFLFGGILFSFNGASQPFLKYSGGNITEVNMVAHTLGVYGLECVSLIMMVTLAFMISTVFRSSSLAIGAGVFLMFVGNMLVMVLARFDWSKYILFANTNLKQYISGTPPVAGMTMTFSIIVLIVYFLIFNVISFMGFSKRDVAA